MQTVSTTQALDSVVTSIAVLRMTAAERLRATELIRYFVETPECHTPLHETPNQVDGHCGEEKWCGSLIQKPGRCGTLQQRFYDAKICHVDILCSGAQLHLQQVCSEKEEVEDLPHVTPSSADMRLLSTSAVSTWQWQSGATARAPMKPSTSTRTSTSHRS